MVGTMSQCGSKQVFTHFTVKQKDRTDQLNQVGKV
uniref:Uncharacterized protein n=1 Tax=Anguilla anguilla TaxID=7936 RepID=A0A0E9Q4D0_ANGAN